MIRLLGVSYKPKYINSGLCYGEKIEIEVKDGIRYSVPYFIGKNSLEEKTEIRFRVDNIYKDCFISVYLDEERILHNKKRILTPGEMENVLITKKMINEYKTCKKILIRIEKE